MGKPKATPFNLIDLQKYVDRLSQELQDIKATDLLEDKCISAALGHFVLARGRKPVRFGHSESPPNMTSAPMRPAGEGTRHLLLLRNADLGQELLEQTEDHLDKLFVNV